MDEVHGAASRPPGVEPDRGDAASPATSSPATAHRTTGPGVSRASLPPVLVDAVVEALFAQSPFSVAMYDAQGHVVLANAAYERHWGLRVADVPADYSLLTDPELAAAGLLPLIHRAYGLDGSPGEHVVTPPLPYNAARVTGGVGRTMWTQGHCYPVRDAAGRITHVAVVHEDVTAAVEAAAVTAALRASEERLGLAQRATAMGVFDWDLATGTLTWSDEIYRLHGLSADAPPTYERWLAAVHPEDRPAAEAFGRGVFEVRRDAAAPGRDGGGADAGAPDEMMEGEYRVMLPGGELRWIASRVRVFFDEQGRPARVLGVNFDLTERKRGDVERARLLAAEREARAAAERAAGRIARLQAVTAALATPLTPAEVARVIVDQAAAALGAAAGVIALTTDDGRALEILHTAGYSPAVTRPWAQIPIDAAVPLAEAARTGAPVIVRSLAERQARYPALRDIASAYPSMASVPLMLDGSALGALGLSFATEDPVSGADSDFLFALGRQCAQAVHRAQLYAAERAARADAERQRADAEAARRRAEEASRAKSEFLAVMSHELRTPLNAIGGYAELIELGIRGPVTEQQREDLARIQSSQRHLLGLINEVLNYARIETGAVRYELADVDLAEVVASVEPLVRPQLAAKRIDYSVAPCPRPLSARADREKVRQVLLNLLSNAVKFSDPGGRVSVECATADGPVGGRVLIRVRDTGIGIPADKLEAVFEPFVQVNAGLTRTQEGTGLGLAISRDLARGMGGDLTAESAAGVGSTFTLVLPGA
jgi:signal transduction histidine kinase/PAS domain-containing protein